MASEATTRAQLIARITGARKIGDSAVLRAGNALPYLISRAPSAIVTICSVNATLPDPGVIDYSAAKAALRSFCKSLSKEVGPAGVRVNTASPGPVETALWLGAGGVAETVAQAQGTDPAQVRAAAVAGTPTARFTRGPRTHSGRRWPRIAPRSA